jgi:hypothetical protein
MWNVVVLALGLVLVSGCGHGASSTTTGPTAIESSEQPAKGRIVRANLRDAYLFDHNAAFNDGHTFRWVPPIPIFVLTGDAETDAILLEQFVAWEGALAGAGGTPFYAPQAATRQIPRRGIFFAVADLPGNTVGLANPLGEPLAERRRASLSLAEKLRRVTAAATPRRLELPELSGSGDIQRCQIILDPALDELPLAAFKHVLRHEIGHCLGFIGHVASPSSVMHASACCPLAITGDVSGMMRKLYSLAPGTDVTR